MFLRDRATRALGRVLPNRRRSDNALSLVLLFLKCRPRVLQSRQAWVTVGVPCALADKLERQLVQTLYDRRLKARRKRRVRADFIVLIVVRQP